MNSPHSLSVTAVAAFSRTEVCCPAYGSKLGACLCLPPWEALVWLCPCVSVQAHALSVELRKQSVDFV